MKVFYRARCEFVDPRQSRVRKHIVCNKIPLHDYVAHSLFGLFARIRHTRIIKTREEAFNCRIELHKIIDMSE